MERKDMKLGFIGFGNMAQAIAEGLLRSKALEPEQICACAKDWDKLCAATQPRGMRPAGTPGRWRRPQMWSSWP